MVTPRDQPKGHLKGQPIVTESPVNSVTRISSKIPTRSSSKIPPERIIEVAGKTTTDNPTKSLTKRPI